MKLTTATPFVLIAAFIISWIVTQGLMFAILVGIVWAAIGIAVKIHKAPWKDAGGLWRSGETGYRTTPRAAYSGLLSIVGSLIAFALFQGNSFMAQILPWLLNAPVGYQLVSVGAFHGIGYVLSR